MVEKGPNNPEIFDDDVFAAQQSTQEMKEKSTLGTRLLKKVQAGLRKIVPPKKEPLTTDQIKGLAERTRAEAELEKAKQDLREQKARGPRTTIKRALSLGAATGLGVAAIIGVRSVHRAGGLSRVQGASDKAVKGVVEVVEGVGSAAEGVGAATKSTGEVVGGVSQKVASLKENPDVLEFVNRAASYPELLWRLGLNDWNKKHPTQPMTQEQLKQIIEAQKKLNAEGKTLDAQAMTVLATEVCAWPPETPATLKDIQKKISKPPKTPEGR